jgi:hypothetical protein
VKGERSLVKGERSLVSRLAVINKIEDLRSSCPGLLLLGGARGGDERADRRSRREVHGPAVRCGLSATAGPGSNLGQDGDVGPAPWATSTLGMNPVLRRFEAEKADPRHGGLYPGEPV